MKKLLLLSILSLVVFFQNKILAQSSWMPNQDAQLNSITYYGNSMVQPDTRSYRMNYADESRWKKLKGAGIILTGVGVACIGGGIALINSDTNDYINDYSDGSITSIGILGVAGGLTAIGGGVTMWAIGGNRLKKIRGRVSFDATPKSAHLVYRF